jgi:hypothetical protein
MQITSHSHHVVPPVSSNPTVPTEFHGNSSLDGQAVDACASQAGEAVRRQERSQRAGIG